MFLGVGVCFGCFWVLLSIFRCFCVLLCLFVCWWIFLGVGEGFVGVGQFLCVYGTI